MLSRETYWKILNTHLNNKNLIKHCLAVEASMLSLAKHFQQDEELWARVGLIHDADWEKTMDNHSKHTKLTVAWLKQAGESDQNIIDAVLSHNHTNNGFREPINLMEWSLYCCDELTGLIVAVALVRPDHKLTSVNTDSVLKKFSQKAFAAGVDREAIKLCEEKMQQILTKHGVDLPGKTNRNRLVDNLWKLIRQEVSGPAFLINPPKFISPLAKATTDNPELVERFQIIIAGSELGNGYTEINDPQDQLERFLAQQKLREAGDEEAQMLDLDYVEMLEYGMPPVSGYGQSERIFWVLEGISAREGTLFPQFSFELDQNTHKIYGKPVTQYTKKSRT